MKKFNTVSHPPLPSRTILHFKYADAISRSNFLDLVPPYSLQYKGIWLPQNSVLDVSCLLNTFYHFCCAVINQLVN